MTIDFDFNKNDLIDYSFWKVKSKTSYWIGELIVSIIFFIIGIGLVLASFIVENFTFLFLAFGISSIVFAFRKSDLRKNIKEKADKLEKEGKLKHYFGKHRLEIHQNKLLITNEVSELKVLGTTITDLGVHGNCIAVQFGLNSLLIPTRNFKTAEEINELVSSINSTRMG